MNRKKSKSLKNKAELLQFYFTEAAIKNINFSVAEEVYEREPKTIETYKLQRQENGFDDTETWHLDRTLALFLIPRLKRYIELNNGIPIGETAESFDQKLHFIIDSLSKYYSDEYDDGEIDERKLIYDNARNAVNSLSSLWFDLWW